MRVNCPSCGIAYEVPKAVAAAGRRARCSRCGHEWPLGSVEAEPAAPAESTISVPEPPLPLPPPEPQAERVARPIHDLTTGVVDHTRPLISEEPEAPRAGIGIRLAWAASIAAVLALLWAGYAFREPVMHAWPPSSRLYSALGLGRSASADRRGRKRRP